MVLAADAAQAGDVGVPELAAMFFAQPGREEPRIVGRAGPHDPQVFADVVRVNLIGTFVTNVWILTIITTDLLIDSLDRARGLSAGTSQLATDVDQQLGAFVGVRTVAPGTQPNPFAPPPG